MGKLRDKGGGLPGPLVAGLIYKVTQYNNSDQFIFLHDLYELQCTYAIISATSVFQSSRKVHHLAPEESPPRAHHRCHHRKFLVFLFLR